MTNSTKPIPEEKPENNEEIIYDEVEDDETEPDDEDEDEDDE